MPYQPYTDVQNPSLPNQYAAGLEDREILKKFFKEYIAWTPLSAFMGDSEESPIVLRDLETGKGDLVTFSLMRELELGNEVGEFERASGKEQNLRFYQQTIPTKYSREPVGLNSPDIVKQRTPLSIFEQYRPSLLRLLRQKLVYELMDSMTWDLYDPATQIPSIHRSLFGTWGGRNAEKNIAAACDEASGTTNLANFANNPYTLNGMSASHIYQLGRIAKMGGSSGYKTENLIRPANLKTVRGFPEEQYILLIDPMTYDSLRQDPDWIKYHVSARNLGDDMPNGLNGARFRGIYEGVLVYEANELSKYRIKSSTAAKGTWAWNILLGASSVGLVWSMKPMFTEEWKDYKDIYGLCSKEYRGQAAFKFPSKLDTSKLVEHGIVHSFTRII